MLELASKDETADPLERLMGMAAAWVADRIIIVGARHLDAMLALCRRGYARVACHADNGGPHSGPRRFYLDFICPGALLLLTSASLKGHCGCELTWINAVRLQGENPSTTGRPFHKTRPDMFDLAMLALAVGFFALAIGYVTLCDHL